MNDWRPGETYYERKARRNDEMIRPLGWMFAVGLVIVMLAMVSGCDAFFGAPGVQADFFECPPNNTLRTCVVGTSPPAADMCEAVGSGTTTITPVNCG